MDNNLTSRQQFHTFACGIENFSGIEAGCLSSGGAMLQSFQAGKCINIFAVLLKFVLIVLLFNQKFTSPSLHVLAN